MQIIQVEVHSKLDIIKKLVLNNNIIFFLLRLKN